MSECTISVNGTLHQVKSDVTLAAALINVGVISFREAGAGQHRGPLCAMGTCFECRVTVNGNRGVRACVESVASGMVVHTE